MAMLHESRVSICGVCCDRGFGGRDLVSTTEHVSSAESHQQAEWWRASFEHSPGNKRAQHGRAPGTDAPPAGSATL